MRKETFKTHMREVEIYRGQGYKNNVFPDNFISTNKYQYLTLIQRNIFEQFQRLGNIWYLIVTLLEYIPFDLSPMVNTSTTVTFVIVLMLTLIHDAYADYLKRKCDLHINSRGVLVWSEERQEFFREKWQEVRVGHIIVVKNDEEIPADMIILATSDPEDICFLETSNLDGETRMSIKKAVPDTAAIFESKSYEKAIEMLYRLDNTIIKIDHPNYNLYSLEGTIKLISYPRALPLFMDNFVYRGTQLKNTNWILGIVVYTGPDTKIMMNTKKIPNKRSKLEIQMNVYLAFMLLILSFMVIICSVLSIVNAHIYEGAFYYFTGKNAKDSLFDIISFAILYSYMVPITFYVVLNIVSLAQSFFIVSDLRFYDVIKSRNIEANNLHLNDELGKIEYIFSDKTGTLTDNDMKFRYSIIKGKTLDISQLSEQFLNDTSNKTFEFLEVLALCHTVIPDKTAHGIEYKGVSRDEEALVKAAKIAGVEYRNIKRNLCELKIQGQKSLYKIYGVNEFDPERKRMSVIIKSVSNESPPILLCKGADSAIFPKSNNSQKYLNKLSGEMEKHAKEGLRTLVIAKRTLTIEEADKYESLWLSAKNAMSKRQERLQEVAEEIERDLTVLGSVAIEDKIQDGAPEAIETLKKAGIKTWILTGDKRETAINAAYACRLFESKMDIIQIPFTHRKRVQSCLKKEYYKYVNPIEESDINLRDIETHELNETPAKEIVFGTDGSNMHLKGNTQKFGLVIDGTSLEIICEKKRYLELFLTLSCLAESVIVCRATPIQKAKIIKLVKENIKTHPVTLAIGDGSNDVSMIQEANVGVGILGNEGTQAANSSDFAIISFRHLVPLLLIHGHYNFSRVAKVIQIIIYYNFMMIFVLFLFSFMNMYSASLLYESWLMTLAHVLFVAVPILIMGIFDQAKSAEKLLANPELYNKNNFNFGSILAHIFIAIYQGLIIFLFVLIFIGKGAIHQDGHTEDYFSLGTVMFLIVLQVTIHEIFLIEKTWNCLFLISSFAVVLFAFVFIFIYDYGSTSTFYIYGTSTKMYSSTGFLILLFVVPFVCLAFRLPFYYFHSLFYKNTEKYNYKKLQMIHKRQILTDDPNNYSNSFDLSKYSNVKETKESALNFNMHPVTLKFENPFLENEFQADLIHDRRKYWRILCFVMCIVSLVGFVISLVIPKHIEQKELTYLIGICFGILLILFCLIVKKSVKKSYMIIMSYLIGVSLLLKLFMDLRFSYEISISNTLISFVSFVIISTNTYITFVVNVLNLIAYSIWLFLEYTTSEETIDGICIGFIYILLSIGILFLSFTIGYTLERSKKLQYRYLERVEFEYNKGQEILANLFPHFIRRKVKKGERAIALQQPDVTVMFCDIYAFDNICATHSPAELIELLDAYFALLDKLCEDYGVAKIETVNKTYMACAGIREDEKLLPKNKLSKNHGERTLEFATEIIEKLEHVYLKTGEKLRVKIGINSGPVIAGVVGLYKPQFSLVGDTVNTASRMCSTVKEPDSIQISTSTYGMVLDGLYAFTPNQVEAKGKGLLDTYIVSKISPPNLTRSWTPPFELDNERLTEEVQHEITMHRFASNKREDFITTKFNRFYTVYKGREKGEVMTKGESVLNDLILRSELSRKELGLVIDVQFCMCQYHSKEEEAEFRTKYMKKNKRSIRIYLWGAFTILFLTTIVHLAAYLFTESQIQAQIIISKLFLLILLSGVLINYRKLYKRALFSWILLFVFFLLCVLNVISMYRSSEILLSFIALEVLFELELIGHICFLPFGNVLVSTLVLMVPTIILIAFRLGSSSTRILIPFVIYNLINASVAFYKEKQARTTFNLHKLMKREIERTKALLNQLIPPHVVRNLMEDHATTDKFNHVTIIFADICGFTAFSSTRTPQEVVSMLSGFFTIFDNLCLVHNVYKVHTIGDCYVIISFRDSEHRRNSRNLENEWKNMVNMAFEMVKAIHKVNKDNGLDLNMRIGIHTGEVIAGITGTNIVRYDIYGPDVDIANKMESGGMPGKINVSEVTKSFIESAFPEDYSYEFNKNITHKPVNRTLQSFFISRKPEQESINS